MELPNLPHKGDLVDWIDTHGDSAEPQGIREEIQALAQGVDPWRPVEVGCLDSSQSELFEDAWPQIRSEAFHGLAGDIVRAIEPHSRS